MSKEENNQEQNQPKDYSAFGYIGDETITMSIQEFNAMRQGLEKALQNGVITDYPQVVKWFNQKGQVDNPTEKQIREGQVRQFADNRMTFSEENLTVRYNSNIFPEIYNALETGMQVHTRMVDEGVAKPIEEVKKAYEERKAKGQMKVVDEQEETPEATTEESTEAPKPKAKKSSKKASKKSE